MSKPLRLTVCTLILTILFAIGGMFGFSTLIGFPFGGALCACAVAGVFAIYKTKFSFFKLLAGWILAGLISIIVALILYFWILGLMHYTPYDSSANSGWIMGLFMVVDCAIGGAIGGFIGVASIAWSLGTDTTKRTYLLVWTIAGALGGSIGIIASFSLTTDFFDFGWASGGIIGGAIFGLIGAIVLLRDLENQRQTAEAQSQVEL